MRHEPLLKCFIQVSQETDNILRRLNAKDVRVRHTLNPFMKPRMRTSTKQWRSNG